LDSHAVRIGHLVNERVPRDSAVLTNARGMNPVSLLSGRQVVIGRMDDLWRRAVNVSAQLALYKQFSAPGHAARKMIENEIQYLCELKEKLLVIWNRSQWPFFSVLDQNDKWLLLKVHPVVFPASESRL
jgi:hypothetical protein